MQVCGYVVMEFMYVGMQVFAGTCRYMQVCRYAGM